MSKPKKLWRCLKYWCWVGVKSAKERFSLLAMLLPNFVAGAKSLMSYQVFVNDDAARDLEVLYDYIESHDTAEKADYVLDKIEQAFSSLTDNPERGAYPNELLAVGLREYRELYFKPYRVIYQIIEKHAYVMVIADGHCDKQSLLQHRLLQA